MSITEPTFVLVLFVLVRCADLAITYTIARSVIRGIVYALVALLALVSALLLLGLH